MLGDDDARDPRIARVQDPRREVLHVLGVGHDGDDDGVAVRTAADALELLDVHQGHPPGPTGGCLDGGQGVHVHDGPRVGLHHQGSVDGSLGTRAALLTVECMPSRIDEHGIIRLDRGLVDAGRRHEDAVTFAHRHVARRAAHPAEPIEASGRAREVAGRGHVASMLVNPGHGADIEFSNVRHVVVDIEGTTSGSAFVYDVLFPYAAERFPAWLDQHASESETERIVADVAREAGLTDPSTEEIVATLRGWVAEDRKTTPLKELQGLIWEEGFASGALVSDFFPDALVALRRWHDAGLPISVYSSGSVLAQRNWYAHSPEGDLTDWIDGYYDTANAGPKRESASYVAITEAIGADPATLLFCSDVVAELDAARTVGWQVVRVRRPGEPHAIEDSAYPEVADMTAIRLT